MRFEAMETTLPTNVPAEGDKTMVSDELSRGQTPGWSDCSAVLLMGWRNLNAVEGEGRQGENEGQGEKMMTEQ